MGRRTVYIDGKAMARERVSGIGHTVRGLVVALQQDEVAKERYRIKVFVPWSGRKYVQDLAELGVGIVRLPVLMRGYDRINALPALPYLDAWLGRGIYIFPNYGNWPLLFSPSIIFIHDIAFLRHPETVGKGRDWLFDNIQRWIRRSTVVATVSEFSKQEIVECLKVSPDKVAVIPWGVDRAVFRKQTPAEVATTRKTYGLPENYILYLGNIEPRKNLVRLIGAYGRLPQTLKDRHPLVLVGGDGWNHEQIEQAIATATSRGNRVLRPEHYVTDRDLPALFSGAAMLAHVAIYEGFGISPLQAMACGVPVMAAASASLPEVVGDAGVYAEALDETDIAAKMELVLSDEQLRAELIAKGLRRAQRFGWEKTATAMLQTLRRVESP